jgi:hypothetical protein
VLGQMRSGRGGGDRRQHGAYDDVSGRGCAQGVRWSGGSSRFRRQLSRIVACRRAGALGAALGACRRTGLVSGMCHYGVGGHIVCHIKWASMPKAGTKDQQQHRHAHRGSLPVCKASARTAVHSVALGPGMDLREASVGAVSTSRVPALRPGAAVRSHQPPPASDLLSRSCVGVRVYPPDRQDPASCRPDPVALAAVPPLTSPVAVGDPHDPCR